MNELTPLGTTVRTVVRLAVAPSANSCRWCGREAREHAIEWVASVGYHTWTAPTSKQRLARMRARRGAA